MRQLSKGAKPSVLESKETQWRDELIEILNRGEKPPKHVKERYRHPDIKAALISETDGKCAYCESKIRHIAHGDIEHIIPKSKVPERAYEWNNLTLACDICNENKGDIYDHTGNDPQLVDPYLDQPSECFLFMREIITPRPDNPRALATESVIKLRRLDLLERRRERMDFLDGLVIAYVLADEQLKPILRKDLFEKHLKDSDEYAASSKAYIAYLEEKKVLG